MLFDTFRCPFYIDLLSHTDRKRLAGADDFLPMLIFVLLKTNVEQLYSNVQCVPAALSRHLLTTFYSYIQRYRYAAKMHDEAGYYFTSVLTAVAFLETADAAALSVDPDEFTKCALFDPFSSIFDPFLSLNSILI